MLNNKNCWTAILLHHLRTDILLRGGGGGGGGGFTLIFFVKLDFEIAVDQQNRAHDQSFDGVPDSGCPPVPAGQPRPYLVIFLLNHLNMLTTMLWGALLVATNLLNICI